MRLRPLFSRVGFVCWSLCGGLGLAAFGAASNACITTDNTPVLTPVTGIVVRADAITNGHGCGTAPTEVFKYAAAVYEADPTTGRDLVPAVPVAAGLYDCFSDGVFFSLSTNTTSVFNVHVFAYDQRDFEASNLTSAIAFDPDAGVTPADAADEAGVAASNDPLTKLAATKVTWRAECTATQQANIEVLAVCSPLASTGGTGSVTLDTNAFDVGGDAGTLRCGQDYWSVQVSYDGPGVNGQVPVATCGKAPVTVSVPSAPVNITFHVSLLSNTGTSAGTVTCSGIAVGGTAGRAGTCTFAPPSP